MSQDSPTAESSCNTDYMVLCRKRLPILDKSQFLSHLYRIASGITLIKVKEKLRKAHPTSLKKKEYNKQNKQKLAACTKGVD